MESRTQDDNSGGRREEAANRYATLGDYLRVIRRHRILVAGIATLMTALAFGLSTLQDPIYRTSAQLSFQDPLQDIDLLTGGAGGSSSVAPAIRAAQNAELVTSPKVTRRVEKSLKQSPASLGASVSTSIGVQTNLVNVTVDAPSAEVAARVANSYASEAEKASDKRERQRLDQAVEALEAEIQEARKSPDATFRASVLDAQLSRIRTLRELAEPASIVRAAGVPGSPISPDTVRNGVLGAALGLFLGLLIAFVRDSLDRRLHSVHDAHLETGLPVLGRVGRSSLGRPGLATGDMPAMPEADFEAFRMLRTNLAAIAGEETIQSVLVTSPLPQEGKSTVSMSLASAAALAGQSVLLLECDLRRPSFSQRLPVKRSPGLSDFLLGNASPKEILQVVKINEPTRYGEPVGSTSAVSDSRAPGVLVCVSAGTAVANSSELLMSDRFEDMLEKASRAYDLVVVDSAPLLSVVDALEIVPHVDCVLTCVRADQTTREQIKAAQSALRHVAERPTGLVVTGIKAGGPDAYDYYYGY